MCVSLMVSLFQINQCCTITKLFVLVCQLPSDPGSCDEATPRYFFNARKGICEEFTYGGCGGNRNNFGTLEECTQQCNPNGRIICYNIYSQFNYSVAYLQVVLHYALMSTVQIPVQGNHCVHCKFIAIRQ